MEKTNSMGRGLQKLKAVKTCAKALYLLGGFEQMLAYLGAVADNDESFSEGLCDIIAEKVCEECANMTVGEINTLRGLF